MEKDGAALLLLIFVLVLAMLGVILFVTGSSLVRMVRKVCPPRMIDWYAL